MKGRTQAAAKLAEARARGLARATIGDFHEQLRADMEQVIAAHPEVEEALKAHLAHYVAPGDCPGCEHPGRFTWGIQHGAGHCAACGWPGRFYHYIQDERPETLCLECQKPRSAHTEGTRYCDVTTDSYDRFRARELLRLETVLWVHPDEVGSR